MSLSEPSQQPYLFLDTETGGLDAERHSLLSLGLVVGERGHAAREPGDPHPA